MVDHSSEGNQSKNKSQVEEDPYFNENNGEKAADKLEVRLYDEIDVSSNDTQTRSNIHIKGESAGGKGEDTEFAAGDFNNSQDDRDVDVDQIEELENNQPEYSSTSNNGEQAAQNESGAEQVGSSGRATQEINFDELGNEIGDVGGNSQDENSQSVDTRSEAGNETQPDNFIPVIEEEEAAPEEAAPEEAAPPELASNEQPVPEAENHAPEMSGVTFETLSSSLSLNENGGTGEVAILSDINDFPTDAITIQLNFTSTDAPDPSLTNGTVLVSYAVPGSPNEFLLFF